MSNSRQTFRDVVAAYDRSLEQQIVGRGSNLVCRDQELWNQVEGLMKDGDAKETHCLGLDPLRVMEESLMEAAAASAPNGGQVKARGGLQGLAKAFEVLEQAALNLYLGPWRAEYKVVKMYSGMFTHYIKPVLSMPQIENVFSLLGYQPSSSRQEQLCLQLSRTNPASLGDLLRLSCAFFLARCECCLLATALGSHVGEAEWELSVVRERQRGHSVKVALENTMKTLRANQPVVEPTNTELDEDLYTDEQVNRGQNEEGVVDEGPRSLTWVTQSCTSPGAVKMLSNGMSSLPSPSTSQPIREHTRISTLNCQLTKTSPGEPDPPRSSSASKRQGRRLCEESTFDRADVHPQSSSLQELSRREAEADQLCSCLQSPHYFRKHCVECKTFHNMSCALVEQCFREGHNVVISDKLNESGSVSPLGESLRVNETLTSSSAAVSSLPLCDGPKSIIPARQPITYHNCCNLAQLDPQVLCVSCSVFHSHSCRDLRDYCQVQHTVKHLEVCECGKQCSRKPLVLCRYCGNEYCNDCWYRNPVTCVCGQTFDQSSSV